jgi:hypothetical protein
LSKILTIGGPSLLKFIENRPGQGTTRRYRKNDKSAEEMADLLVNLWQGALLRMKIEKSPIPLKQCCENLLGDFLKPSVIIFFKTTSRF